MGKEEADFKKIANGMIFSAEKIKCYRNWKFSKSSHKVNIQFQSYFYIVAVDKWESKFKKFTIPLTIALKVEYVGKIWQRCEWSTHKAPAATEKWKS